MEHIGYSIVNKDGEEIQYWGDTSGILAQAPNPVSFPNGVTVCGWLEPGSTFGDDVYVQRWLSYDNNPRIVYEGGKVIVYRVKPTTPIVPGLEFLSRYTLEEYAGIKTAARQVPQLDFWIDMLRLTGSIDVSSQAALEAKAMLVSSGLLTQERADVIFSVKE